MKYLLSIIFFVVIYSGNFPQSPDKTWSDHLVEDCGVSEARVDKMKTVINHYTESNWNIFFSEGVAYLEEM